MEIVINKCYGGFGLSIKAKNLYAKKKGFELFHYKQTAYDFDGGKNAYQKIGDGDSMFSFSLTKDMGDYFEGELPMGKYWSHYDIKRTDPDLVAVVKELGRDADGECSQLEVIEIPDGIEWELEEYDGMEWASEAHRTWS